MKFSELKTETVQYNEMTKQDFIKMFFKTLVGKLDTGERHLSHDEFLDKFRNALKALVDFFPFTYVCPSTITDRTRGIALECEPLDLSLSLSSSNINNKIICCVADTKNKEFCVYNIVKKDKCVVTKETDINDVCWREYSFVNFLWKVGIGFSYVLGEDSFPIIE